MQNKIFSKNINNINLEITKIEKLSFELKN